MLLLVEGLLLLVEVILIETVMACRRAEEFTLRKLNFISDSTDDFLACGGGQVLGLRIETLKASCFPSSLFLMNKILETRNSPPFQHSPQCSCITNGRGQVRRE